MAVGERRLGSGGPLVGLLGLGCMGMSQSYGVRDDAESIATLHRAIDLGVTRRARREAGPGGAGLVARPGRTWSRSRGPCVGSTSRRTWLRPTCS